MTEQRNQRITLLMLFSFVALMTGCKTLREIAALRQVNFSIDRVADVRLAGIDVARIRSFSDLSPVDALNLTRAVTRKELPLSFQLHLLAENPPDNSVSARLVKLDWMLLLEDRETISGVFEDEVVLPPGQPQDVPFAVSLDLMEFFEKSAPDLVDLALAITGQGGAPKEIKLRATPTVNTALGPIRYPQPITILSREVGN